ncbi:MAG: hypothetical protein NTZ95_01905 [Candidatus Omnitrophica bacterium]|nr:hypothetical protein [Candidatus Omnitrophota bacterium]
MVATKSDDLAKRDARAAGQVESKFGRTVGFVGEENGEHVGYVYNPTTSELEKKTQEDVYRTCDIIYGTVTTFVHRYEQEEFATDEADMALSSRKYFVLFDEADDPLVYQLMTPFIISGNEREGGAQLRDQYIAARELAMELYDNGAGISRGYINISEQEKKRIKLTYAGIREISARLGSRATALFNLEPGKWGRLIEQALTAEICYGVEDYAIVGNEIVIIDNGVKQPGRRWSNGLHSAIEAKHAAGGVEVRTEQDTSNQMMLMDFLKRSGRVIDYAGASGTMDDDFILAVHGKEVVHPVASTGNSLIETVKMYRTEAGKWEGFYKDVVTEMGKPEKPAIYIKVREGESDKVETQLRSQGITGPIMKFDAFSETDIDTLEKTAGKSGAITIVTNRGARGVDVKLDELVARSGQNISYSTYIDELAATDKQFRRRLVRRPGDTGAWRAYWSIEDKIFSEHGELPGARDVFDAINDKFVAAGEPIEAKDGAEPAEVVNLIGALRKAIMTQKIQQFQQSEPFNNDMQETKEYFKNLRKLVTEGDLDSLDAAGLPGVRAAFDRVPAEMAGEFKLTILGLLDNAFSRYLSTMNRAQYDIGQEIQEAGVKGEAIQTPPDVKLRDISAKTRDSAIQSVNDTVASYLDLKGLEWAASRVARAGIWRKAAGWGIGGVIIAAMISSFTYAFKSIGFIRGIISSPEGLSPVTELFSNMPSVYIAVTVALVIIGLAIYLVKVKKFSQVYRGQQNLALALRGVASSRELAGAVGAIPVSILQLLSGTMPIGSLLALASTIMFPQAAPVVVIAALAMAAIGILAGAAISIIFHKKISLAVTVQRTGFQRAMSYLGFSLAAVTGTILLALLSGSTAGFAAGVGAIALAGMWARTAFSRMYAQTPEGKALERSRPAIKAKIAGVAAMPLLLTVLLIVAKGAGSVGGAFTAFTTMGSMIVLATTVLYVIAAPYMARRFAAVESEALGKTTTRAQFIREIFELTAPNLRGMIVGFGAAGAVVGGIYMMVGGFSIAALTLTVSSVTLIAILGNKLLAYRKSVMARMARGEKPTGVFERLAATESKKMVKGLMASAIIAGAVPSIGMGAEVNRVVAPEQSMYKAQTEDQLIANLDKIFGITIKRSAVPKAPEAVTPESRAPPSDLENINTRDIASGLIKAAKTPEQVDRALIVAQKLPGQLLATINTEAKARKDAEKKAAEEQKAAAEKKAAEEAAKVEKPVGAGIGPGLAGPGPGPGGGTPPPPKEEKPAAPLAAAPAPSVAQPSTVMAPALTVPPVVQAPAVPPAAPSVTASVTLEAQKAAEEARKAAEQKAIADKKALAEKKAAAKKKAVERKRIAAEKKAAAEIAAEETRKAAEQKAAAEKAVAEKKAAEEQKAAAEKAAEERSASKRLALIKVSLDPALYNSRDGRKTYDGAKELAHKGDYLGVVKNLLPVIHAETTGNMNDALFRGRAYRFVASSIDRLNGTVNPDDIKALKGALEYAKSRDTENLTRAMFTIDDIKVSALDVSGFSMADALTRAKTLYDDENYAAALETILPVIAKAADSDERINAEKFAFKIIKKYIAKKDYIKATMYTHGLIAAHGRRPEKVATILKEAGIDLDAKRLAVLGSVARGDKSISEAAIDLFMTSDASKASLLKMLNDIATPWLKQYGRQHWYGRLGAWIGITGTWNSDFTKETYKLGAQISVELFNTEVKDLLKELEANAPNSEADRYDKIVSGIMKLYGLWNEGYSITEAIKLTENMIKELEVVASRPDLEPGEKAGIEGYIDGLKSQISHAKVRLSSIESEIRPLLGLEDTRKPFDFTKNIKIDSVLRTCEEYGVDAGIPADLAKAKAAEQWAKVRYDIQKENMGFWKTVTPKSMTLGIGTEAPTGLALSNTAFWTHFITLKVQWRGAKDLSIVDESVLKRTKEIFAEYALNQAGVDRNSLKTARTDVADLIQKLKESLASFELERHNYDLKQKQGMSWNALDYGKVSIEILYARAKLMDAEELLNNIDARLKVEFGKEEKPAEKTRPSLGNITIEEAIDAAIENNPNIKALLREAQFDDEMAKAYDTFCSRFIIGMDDRSINIKGSLNSKEFTDQVGFDKWSEPRKNMLTTLVSMAPAIRVGRAIGIPGKFYRKSAEANRAAADKDKRDLVYDILNKSAGYISAKKAVTNAEAKVLDVKAKMARAVEVETRAAGRDLSKEPDAVRSPAVIGAGQELAKAEEELTNQKKRLSDVKSELETILVQRLDGIKDESFNPTVILANPKYIGANPDPHDSEKTRLQILKDRAELARSMIKWGDVAVNVSGSYTTADKTQKVTKDWLPTTAKTVGGTTYSANQSVINPATGRALQEEVRTTSGTVTTETVSEPFSTVSLGWDNIIKSIIGRVAEVSEAGGVVDTATLSLNTWDRRSEEAVTDARNKYKYAQKEFSFAVDKMAGVQRDLDHRLENVASGKLEAGDMEDANPNITDDLKIALDGAKDKVRAEEENLVYRTVELCRVDGPGAPGKVDSGKIAVTNRAKDYRSLADEITSRGKAMADRRAAFNEFLSRAAAVFQFVDIGGSISKDFPSIVSKTLDDAKRALSDTEVYININAADLAQLHSDYDRTKAAIGAIPGYVANANAYMAQANAQAAQDRANIASLTNRLSDQFNYWIFDSDTGGVIVDGQAMANDSASLDANIADLSTQNAEIGKQGAEVARLGDESKNMNDTLSKF